MKDHITAIIRKMMPDSFRLLRDHKNIEGKNTANTAANLAALTERISLVIKYTIIPVSVLRRQLINFKPRIE